MCQIKNKKEKILGPRKSKTPRKFNKMHVLSTYYMNSTMQAIVNKFKKSTIPKFDNFITIE